MPSLEDLKREKERLELERDIRRLQKQNDRREAVEKAKDRYANDSNFRGDVLMFGVCGAVLVLVVILLVFR